MPFHRLLRLGLRQFAAGMLSVLAVGILNRVMKVEMGLDLGLVSVVIGVHYFAAPIAIPFGHRSDRKPYFGFHRTPYILFGALMTVAATIAAPFVALLLQAHSGSAPFAILFALVFLLLGTGNYAAGTAYLSLIADLTPEKQRGRAVAIVWSMMMIGILAGVFIGVGILDNYSPNRLITLFVLVGLLIALLTLIAVWGMESRKVAASIAETTATRQVWRLMATGRQTRLFFAFLFTGILFLFIQNAVLEPFGGDVFKMSVGQTTRFNAYQMVGVLSGMAVSGRWISPRLGNKITAGLGLVLGSVSFLGLAIASMTSNALWVAPSILLMGLGMGFFNVGGLALMMGMTVEGQIGMYMGAWTLSQAMANGLASVSGGYLHDLALAISGLETIAYAAVFFIEAIGLAVTFALLKQLSIKKFQQENLPAATIWAEAG